MDILNMISTTDFVGHQKLLAIVDGYKLPWLSHDARHHTLGWSFRAPWGLLDTELDRGKKWMENMKEDDPCRTS